MTNKTNKTGKKVTVKIDWPATHFTIDDAQKKYPGIVNITLRFRVKKAIESKELVVIGKIKPAIGRPKLVFAKVNPSKELIDAAVAVGMILPNEGNASVTVAEVKTEKKVAPAKAVAPVAAPKESALTVPAAVNS